MDTKLKNFRYLNNPKVIAYILLLIFSIVAALSVVFLLKNSDVILSKHYYDTKEFTNQFDQTLLFEDMKDENSVIENFKPGNAFYELASRFQSVKANFPYILIAFLISIIIVLMLLYYLIIAIRRKERKSKIARLLNDTTLLVCKIYNVIRKRTDILREKRFLKAWFIILLLFYGLMNVFLTSVYSDVDNTFIIILIIVLNVSAVWIVVKWASSLFRIVSAVNEMSKGSLNYTFDTSGISLTFAGFAQSIKNMGEGLNKAVSEAVKAERMRTDLITNVSHDLKTPLTSIINYVDLLKNEVPCSSKSQEYLSILEEKSARLKVLIEDLMEASKASSGNIAVNLEKVDLNQLMMQALGEFQEKLEASKLDVILDSKEKNLFILSDGRHMWRVVENLMSNVVKYSMPDTRVYINLEQIEDKCVLTIKNISKTPLNISPEQLTERFVRGEESRTTEGSGLGLSIAQSLIKIQKGNLLIEIDGDLFKTTVEMPLIKE